MTPPRNADSPKRLLVVDDDALLVEMLTRGLKASGFDVTSAANGRDALRLLTSQKFDLVVLDIMMPYVDGYHVAHELAALLGDNAPKVLLITGRDTSRESGVILMSGADAAIQKPFELPQILSKIEELLGKGEARG
jgi:DNA-binding response OmpR family regulator